MLEQLKLDLPNFPTEILSDWLLPLAELKGWPASQHDDKLPEGSWRYLLLSKPLKFWRNVKWKKIDRHISIYDLDKKYQEGCTNIVLGAVKGQKSLYTIFMPNLAETFYNIVNHIKDNGTLPKPPIILRRKTGLHILDGNHRMSAYLYCYGYFNLDVDPKLKISAKEIQSYWMA